MRNRNGRALPLAASGLLSAMLLASGTVAMAADAASSGTNELHRKINQQTERLEALKRAVAEEEAKLADIKQALGLGVLGATRGGAAPAGGLGSGVTVAQTDAQQPTPVGQAPARKDEGRPPQIAPIFEQPGVLTQPGKYVIEPSLQYMYSSNNRVSLIGYTVIPALLIGLIDIREVKQNTFTAALTTRVGLTNRLEVEAKIPWVYRSESTLTREILDPTARERLFDSSGKGIGDIEATARYQFNDGGIGKPYYIGSLRFKSRTGKDSFEVDNITAVPGARTNLIQKELPTGSGFYTLQPGLTVLFPSDPAVFFGGVSYQYNFKRTNVSLNTNEGPEPIGDIQAGGVFGFNFGMGLALNDRSSFSLGYDHQSVGPTKQNGATAANSVRFQLGTLLMGLSYRLNDKQTVNVALGAGLTTDTPDVQLTVRVPMTF